MTWQEALRDIESRNGILNAEDVVSEAKNKKSPLHSKFTWDDTVAGKLYRIHQARNLIRVYVEILPEAEDGIEHNVFVSLREDRYEGGGYRTIVNVMQDDCLRQKLLNDAKQELQYFKNKYKMLKELASVFEEIDKL